MAVAVKSLATNKKLGPSETEGSFLNLIYDCSSSQPAQAGFVCVAAIYNRPVYVPIVSQECQASWIRFLEASLE